MYCSLFSITLNQQFISQIYYQLFSYRQSSKKSIFRCHYSHNYQVSTIIIINHFLCCENINHISTILNQLVLRHQNCHIDLTEWLGSLESPIAQWQRNRASNLEVICLTPAYQEHSDFVSEFPHLINEKVPFVQQPLNLCLEHIQPGTEAQVIGETGNQINSTEIKSNQIKYWGKQKYPQKPL